MTRCDKAWPAAQDWARRDEYVRHGIPREVYARYDALARCLRATTWRRLLRVNVKRLSRAVRHLILDEFQERSV